MTILQAEASIVLPDGRKLSYAEYGVPGGRPVLWCHGLPGSRLDLSIGAGPALLAELGLHVLAPDRPGFGRSDLHPGRSYASFARDIRVLCDAREVQRFAAVGYSAGAGYALACAAVLGDRVDAVTVVSGAGPRSTPGFVKGMWRTDRLMLPLSRRAPALARALLRPATVQARRRPEAFLRSLRRDVAGSPHDVQVLADPDAAERVLTAFTEATARGPAGCVTDWGVWARPWDVDLSLAAGCPVQLWHGDEDPVIPLHHAQHLHALVPGSALQVWPGEGHFHDDLRWREVLTPLRRPDPRSLEPDPTSRRRP